MIIGRPQMFATDTVDCELPVDIEATTDSEGVTFESGESHNDVCPLDTNEGALSVRHWRYRAVKDFGSRVCDIMNSAKSVPYDEVVNLDRSLREFGCHVFFHLRGDEEHRLRIAGRATDDIHPVISFMWVEQGPLSSPIELVLPMML